MSEEYELAVKDGPSRAKGHGLNSHTLKCFLARPYPQVAVLCLYLEVHLLQMQHRSNKYYYISRMKYIEQDTLKHFIGDFKREKNPCRLWDLIP